MPEFSKFVKVVPELSKEAKVVVIGYLIPTCPFSKLAHETIEKHIKKDPSVKGNIIFIELARGHMADEFRLKSDYEGTFPIVFVRDDGHMKDVNGASGYRKYVESL